MMQWLLRSWCRNRITSSFSAAAWSTLSNASRTVTGKLASVNSRPKRSNCAVPRAQAPFSVTRYSCSSRSAACSASFSLSPSESSSSFSAAAPFTSE
uniref:Putative secreted protein n=1 Tax=Ixodes ricinus TaxID=34613 RepID=A0A6B0U490_IXORI